MTKGKTKNKKGRPKKGRPAFSSGFPELDEVYQRVSEQLYSSEWFRPFKYEFWPEGGSVSIEDPIPGQAGIHSMTVGGQFRFLRSHDQYQVRVYVRNAESWQLVPHNELSNRLRPRPSHEDMEHRTLLTKVSPVFWPITSASPSESLNNIFPLLSTLWRQQWDSLKGSHPHLFTPRPVQVQYPYPQKVERISHAQRAEMILSRRVKSYTRTSGHANYRFAIKCWWDHFVDRELLKTIVAVSGSSSASQLSFSSYAAFTTLPNLKDVITQVSSMGQERRLLKSVPFTQWSAQKAYEQIPFFSPHQSQRLFSLPQSTQIVITTNIDRLKGMTEISPALILDLLEGVARHRPVLRARQQGMAALAVVSLIERAVDSNDEFDLRFPPPTENKVRYAQVLSRPDAVDLLVDLVQIWRRAFPDEYATFSSESRQNFINAAMFGLVVSPANRLDFSDAVLENPENSGFSFHGPPSSLKLLISSSSKYYLEKMLPRRGPGRPRKHEKPVLHASCASTSPRQPVM